MPSSGLAPKMSLQRRWVGKGEWSSRAAEDTQLGLKFTGGASAQLCLKSPSFTRGQNATHFCTVHRVWYPAELLLLPPPVSRGGLAVVAPSSFS